MNTLAPRKSSTKKSTQASPANRSYVKEKAFKSMSAPERRIAIAKDVIAGIKAKRLIAQEGTYFLPTVNKEKAQKLNLKLDEFGSKQNFEDVLDLQQIFKCSMKSCEVCAKGALFIAAVEKFDTVKDEDEVEAVDAISNLNGDWICEPLVENGFFSRSQLDLIEAFFEGFNADQFGTPTERISQTFLDIYPKAEDRMIEIMKNIIANGGTFKPSKLL